MRNTVKIGDLVADFLQFLSPKRERESGIMRDRQTDRKGEEDREPMYLTNTSNHACTSMCDFLS